MESRFLEPSVSRTSRYLEPNLVSLAFASLKLYNFTPDFSNPRFPETPDKSKHFCLPWDKLTLDNSTLGKFPNHLVRMSITFTSLNKLALPDNLVSLILITSRKSVISLNWKVKWLLRITNTVCTAIGVLITFSFAADDAHLDNLRKSTRNMS